MHTHTLSYPSVEDFNLLKYKFGQEEHILLIASTTTYGHHYKAKTCTIRLMFHFCLMNGNGDEHSLHVCYDSSVASSRSSLSSIFCRKELYDIAGRAAIVLVIAVGQEFTVNHR